MNEQIRVTSNSGGTGDTTRRTVTAGLLATAGAVICSVALDAEALPRAPEPSQVIAAAPANSSRELTPPRAAKRDFSARYAAIRESAWFQEAYVGKSLGDVVHVAE